MTPLAFDMWMELILKGTMVLGAAAATSWAMRRASAATRHMVWAAAVSALLVLPALTLVMPALTLPVSLDRVQPAPRVSLPVLQNIVSDRAVHASRAVDTAAKQAHPAQARSGSDPASTRTIVVSTTEIVLAVWALGAMVLLVRLVTALVTARRIVATAEAVDHEAWHEQLEAAAAALGVARLPLLLWSPALSVPMTCGLTRPAILLPCAALHWDAARRRVVLLHELAHIRRRDCLVHCLAQAALALHWCNPLMWLALARLRAERERACDDLVLVAGTRGSDYAQHLLDIARQFRGRSMGVAAVAMARPSELEGRLLAILDPLRSRRPADRARLLWAIAAGALIVLPVSGLRLQARAVVPDDAQPSAQAPPPTPTPAPTPAPAPAGRGGVAGGVSGGVRGGVAPVVAAGKSPGQDAVSRREAIPDSARAQVAQALAAALKDENADVRAEAMQALARMRSPLAFDPMVAALRDASPDVRQQAAFSLGQLRDARAVGPLTAALKDTEPDVRQQVVFALGQITAKEAVPGIVAALKDENVEVRQQAAFALGQVGGPSAVQPLVSVLQDTNDEVREQAVFALGRVGDKSAVPALVQALSDAKPSVRQQAAFALGHVGDATAVDALTKAMSKDTDPEVRQQAAFALGQVFGRESDEPQSGK
jgi:HEAT repeat protein/beta-lactamase regulating signal transducer with metallopeptidase domain